LKKEKKKTDKSSSPYQKFIKFKNQTDEDLIKFDNQDIYSVRLKLNRRLAVNDSVVLLKDHPNYNLHRRYVCVILDVYYDWSSWKDQTAHDYQVEFALDFDEKDPSRVSADKQKNEANIYYDPILTKIVAEIAGPDLLRIEIQNLRYRISFKIF